MASQDLMTPHDLIEISRTVDRALGTHDRPEALAGAERLLEALFAHHRALRRFCEHSDPITATVLETATVGMIAEVALTLGELADGGRWPEPLLRAHVDELIDIEADCGVMHGSQAT
jgi:hypothetical protein